MKSRLILAFLVTAACILAPLHGGQAQQDQGAKTAPCPLHLVAKLDMQTINDGRVTIPVQFEGHDHRLMVDTGGYINTVTPLLVREEGYRKEVSHGTMLKGMGNRFLDHFVETKDFAIGRSHGRNYDFFIDDFSDLSADGTLAPEILAAYDIDFDFGHDRMNLIHLGDCPGREVYWTKIPAAVVPMRLKDNTHIRIPMMIDGKEIMATLDTGSATSYIRMHAAGRYLDIDEKNPNLKSHGNVAVNGMAGPIYSYPFKELSFGGVTVSHPHIEIVSDPVWTEDDLLMGIDILRQLHIYIAYGEKKLYITPALPN